MFKDFCLLHVGGGRGLRLQDTESLAGSRPLGNAVTFKSPSNQSGREDTRDAGVFSDTYRDSRGASFLLALLLLQPTANEAEIGLFWQKMHDDRVITNRGRVCLILKPKINSHLY